MKRLLITTALALGVFTSSGHAAKLTPEEQHKDYKKYSCIPECPFFAAWAMTKVCRGVYFNERGRAVVKTYTSDSRIRRWSREVVRREMVGVKRGGEVRPGLDCSHPECESLTDEGAIEDSACGFIRGEPPRKHRKDVVKYEKLKHQCLYHEEDKRSEEETAKICAASDAIEKRLKDWGFCIYGDGIVGRYSEDKKLCYFLQREDKP